MKIIKTATDPRWMGAASRAFTLVEIMVVIAVIAIVVAIATPTWLRQREISRGRGCQENLYKIDGAKEQYALEYRASNGTTVDMSQLMTPPNATAGAGEGYLKAVPSCFANGTYTVNAVGAAPTCSIGTTAFLEPHVLQQ